MTRRYFAPDLASAGGMVELDRQESSHAAKVMRVKVSDQLTLFDGRGNEATGEVIAVDPRRVQIRSEAIQSIDRDPSVRFTIGVSLPRPERAKEMVERLTEIGVQCVVPLVCERTQRAPTAKQLDKLRRIVIEACKQCGRNSLMSIAEPKQLADALDSLPKGLRWVLDPTGQRSRLAIASGQTTSALVGPEGGWSDAELKMLDEHRVERLSLGPRIYRIETAAVVIAARAIDI